MLRLQLDVGAAALLGCHVRATVLSVQHLLRWDGVGLCVCDV